MGKRSVPANPPTDGPHVPVLLTEVLAAVAPRPGLAVLDGTFGAGGYSEALLAAGARVIAMDRDPGVRPRADALAARFGDRFRFVSGNFSGLADLGEAVDAVVLDIGVSSMQLDQAERGFSFMREGPLDMRMSGAGTSAADLVNGLAEAELADLIYAYGEERRSRRIAKAIVLARAEEPIATTTALARIVEAAIGRKPGDPHPATRTFQALRIAVNAELDELVAALFAAERLLAPGGLLAVVTFHSLEDRIVKRFFDPERGAPARSRHLPQTEPEARRWAEVARAVKPGRDELERNPRARSATLRHARRTEAPARPPSVRGLGVPGGGRAA